MASWMVDLPVWELIRISGFICYALLLTGIALGILYSYPVWRGRTKQRLFKLHKLTVNGGTVLALMHTVLPVISPFMPFTWAEVLIPFAASDHRILNGIGTLAAYGLLVLIFTSDIRNVLKRKLWYLIHLLSYPLFILVWIHGYFLGTDTGMIGVRWMYLMSLVLLAVLTAGRAGLKKPDAPSARLRQYRQG